MTSTQSTLKVDGDLFGGRMSVNKVRVMWPQVAHARRVAPGAGVHPRTQPHSKLHKLPGTTARLGFAATRLANPRPSPAPPAPTGAGRHETERRHRTIFPFSFFLSFPPLWSLPAITRAKETRSHSFITSQHSVSVSSPTRPASLREPTARSPLCTAGLRIRRGGISPNGLWLV